MVNVRSTWSFVLLLSIVTWQIANVPAKYHHIKLRHERHRRQHAEGYLPSSFVLDNNNPEEGLWGPWTAPSSCSRSCGGGVAHQTRRCLDVDDNGSDRCTGAKKRFFSCNIQPCPSGLVDFRSEQCTEYNTVSFEDVLYDWIPYTGGPNKCALDCMPRGERFFYRHRPHVIDGTPCELEKNDVCVEGKCMPVGCDMMLGSDAAEDACRECGGDGSKCNTISGLFDTDDLQTGYVDILLIPEGATNIDIKEIAPSNNYLAIRNKTGHYYLNGNWRIDFPKSLSFAGTTFHYERYRQGLAAPDSITSQGPTNEAIYIVLLYQDTNVGVEYEYSIPKKFSPQGDPDAYFWTADEFSECSVSCGGGFQSRRVNCVKSRNNGSVDEGLCNPQLEPDDTQSCNEEACPPEWIEGEWGPCSKYCGEGGERERAIKCEQLIAGGIPTIVDDSVCLESVGPKNQTTQECNRNVECPKWHIGPWKPCDHLCGKGKQTRKVTCFKKNDAGKIDVLEDSACEGEIPEREKPCELRPCAGLDWVMSEWSGCDDKCGLTQETRTAHCATQDGTVYADDKCDESKKPVLARECENTKGCEYQWYSTQWSECSAKCGSGVQTRKVFCATFEDELTLKKVPDEKCDPDKRYNDTRNCTTDVECKGEWYAGPWSKCSKPCGGGDMTRKVICMKDGVLVPTSNCDVDSIMFSNEDCNKHPCGEDEVIPVQPGKDNVPTDEKQDCEVYKDEEDFVTSDSSFSSARDEDEMELKGSTSVFSSETGFTATTMDDMMLSDAAYSRGDISPTDSGSGEGSGFSSDDLGFSFISWSTTAVPSSDDISTSSTEESSTLEGSGTSVEADYDYSETTGTLFSDKEETSSSSEISDTATEDYLPTDTSVFTESDTLTDITEVSGLSESSSSTDIPVSTEISQETSEQSSGSITESSATESSTVFSTEFSSSDSSTDGSTELSTSDSSSVGISDSSTDVTDRYSESSTVESSPESSTSSVNGETDITTMSVDTTISPVSESTESTESSDTTESTELPDTTESTDLTNSTESTESPDTTESTGLTDSTESTESSESTESPDTTESTDLTDSTESTESSESTESPNTTESTESSQPTDTSMTESTPTSSSDDTTTDASATETNQSASESTVDVQETRTSERSVTDEPTTVSAIVRAIGEFDLSAVAEKSATTIPLTTMDSIPASTSDFTSTEVTSESSEVTTVVTASGSSDSESTTIELATTESGSTTSDSDITTESGATTDYDTTISGMTTESSQTTESGVTTESSQTTESGVTTESSQTTESEVTTDSGATTESSETTMSGLTTESSETTASGQTTESSETTESGQTTESGGTTEFTTEVTTVSGDSTDSIVSGETDGSTVASTDEEDTTGQSTIIDLFTPVSSIDVAITKEHELRKCKIRKKTCRNSQFGCCYDGITASQGPFDEGCPTPKTCAETKFGCCPDGVSVATGPENENCPSQHCDETLFGCCQDGVTPAEGNDFEGCKKPCNETEFGCCPDKETPAIGKNNLGCCNVTKYGCCPDGMQSATGPDDEGCLETVTDDSEWTEITSEYETTTMIPMEVEDCANSTYGCCPDGKRTASGTNFDGCGVINMENCSASYFGCCEDGVSAALGPRGEGCHAECESSTYGCCPDNTTPAHGPNGEGCCLSSPYKCCPDNIIPALGPDFHGCECEYTRFRCCPDNVTAARGPDNEGCGCQYTKHGCCPNRFTPATGPNFEGCPCYTYQFGCCPDGVTIATGPRSRGCGCENTEYGCCSDNQTPAKGANFAGCTCDSSKFGCCPDGVEEAQGDNFEGCLSTPDIPSAACALGRDRGSCRDFTVKWFYDTEYGGCSRFWYGGCEGNGNRFTTQEECKDTCISPEGRDVCHLPKSSGPCESYLPQWYYDSERKQCGQFIYKGCLGNDNRFETREACEDRCVIPDDIDPCELPQEVGPCQGNFTRWYFNKESQMCEQFHYGGCKANTNNFLTEIACHQQCLQPGRSRDSCSLPRTEGSCTKKLSRWYFDQSENRCMPFYSTGCGENKNNFETREACETDCPPKIEEDTCLLPALLGECHNYTARWYFDSYEGQCRQFYYGGCGGNNNNFISQQECTDRCEPTAVTAPPATPQRFSAAMCFLPDEQGPCAKNETKWFYDSRDGICKQFIYGGCASNGNKFESRDECEYRCGEVQDACSMPKIVGPCSGSMVQYYYDRQTDMCKQFEYSGCAGNRNRFQDRDACESKCRRRPPPVQLSTSLPHSPSEIVPSSPICSAPVDAGPCNNVLTAYYYDPGAHTCQAFVYGGCEGNANRFQSEEQCERLCGRFQGQDVCNLPVDVGPCRGSFAKYYYDPHARSCRNFMYGGCDGNANRFSTAPECESVCLHREEPTPAGNNTALSHLEICREPVDVGSCPTGNYKRFYFDEERQNCMGFVYTGCGGNRNRFKTYDSCMRTCYRTSNEVDIGGKNASKDPCDEAKEECNIIHCPYGKEAYVDEHDCEHCRCVDPCSNVICPEGTRCSITLGASAIEGTEYKGVCRSTTKPGRCPVVSNSTRCEQECASDADCSRDWKCCSNGCGTSCLEPAPEQPVYTPPPPPLNITSRLHGTAPAEIVTPDDPRVRGEEGGYVNMKCIATGDPKPKISWKKEGIVINVAEKRRRILADGTLEIIDLYGYDSGTYICTADNGLAPPARVEYQLQVDEPHDNPAAIVGEPNTFTTVTLNSPTILHCYAMGWPRPFVTWWHGDRMLPLSSEYYEQDSEYTLLIRSVTISNLGVYTCQAYNGIERPASWSMILQAIGPVYNVKPEHQEYLRYLVQPPKRPATDKPQYPYRPARTQAPEHNQTYAPIYPTQRPYIPPVVPLTDPPVQEPVKFKVPVAVNVTVSGKQFPVGSEISIGCAVDGYPIPRVLWYRNDDLIRTDGRVTISESNRLLITNAGHNDTGSYRCEAANQYSSDSQTIDLEITGMYIDPGCQDNTFFAKCDLIVKAKYCEHKYYAKFCCRSCTEAGQLPSHGQYRRDSSRRKRSLIPLY